MDRIKFILIQSLPSNGASGPLFDVSPSGFFIREGEAFTLGGFGDLTGTTSVLFDGVASTSIVIAGDTLSLTAVAPADGVRYDEEIAVEIS